MSNIIYALILSFLAGLSTLLGGLIIFFNISYTKKDIFISFCLAFSMGVMIFLSIFDLFPEALKSMYNSINIYLIIILIVIFILCYLLIKFCISYSSNLNSLYKLGIVSMIILMMHNLPEGILTFLSGYVDYRLGLKMSIAIALHNIPEGVSIAVPIYYATGSKKKALFKTLISGLSEPLGALLAYLLLSKYINDLMIGIVLFVVGSLMITLSIEGILPEANKYKNKKSIYFGLLLGILLASLSIFL